MDFYCHVFFSVFISGSQTYSVGKGRHLLDEKEHRPLEPWTSAQLQTAETTKFI